MRNLSITIYGLMLGVSLAFNQPSQAAQSLKCIKFLTKDPYEKVKRVRRASNADDNLPTS